jgi:hypothetical protein
VNRSRCAFDTVLISSFYLTFRAKDIRIGLTANSYIPNKKEYFSMKRTIVRFSLFFVLVSTLIAISVAAQATTVTIVTQFSNSFTITACIEDVAFEGNFRIITHSTFSDSGHVTVKQNVNFQLEGVGQTTGSRYIAHQSAQSQDHFDSIDFAPFNTTSTSHFFFNGQGGVPNLRANGSQHSTINANGELTVFRSVFNIECS